eukprot:4447190-Prymnesium_polylepis.1
MLQQRRGLLDSYAGLGVVLAALCHNVPLHELHPAVGPHHLLQHTVVRGVQPTHAVGPRPARRDVCAEPLARCARALIPAHNDTARAVQSVRVHGADPMAHLNQARGSLAPRRRACPEPLRSRIVGEAVAPPCLLERVLARDCLSLRRL